MVKISEFGEAESYDIGVMVVQTRWRVLRAPGRVRSSRSVRKVMGFVGLGSLLLLDLTSAIATAQDRPRSVEGQKTRTVLDEKASRTPAQRKISSELLERMRESQRPTAKCTTREPGTGVSPEPEGDILVDIKANVTDQLLSQIRALGGTVLNSFPQYEATRARLPVNQLETLAESSDVKSIRSADQLQLNR